MKMDEARVGSEKVSIHGTLDKEIYLQRLLDEPSNAARLDSASHQKRCVQPV